MLTLSGWRGDRPAGAARPSGCQWGNDAKQERKWASAEQSEKQSCQPVDKQSWQLHQITPQQFLSDTAISSQVSIKTEGFSAQF